MFSHFEWFLLFYIFIFLYFVFAVPRVSTDGDSHEILTLVACCSGLTVAVIVIIIIVFVMDCGNIDAAHVHRNRNRSHRLCNDIESQLNGTEICATKTIDAGNDKTKQIANENRMQIFTILDGNGETIGSQATIDRTLWANDVLCERDIERLILSFIVIVNRQKWRK